MKKTYNLIEEKVPINCESFLHISVDSQIYRPTLENEYTARVIMKGDPETLRAALFFAMKRDVSIAKIIMEASLAFVNGGNLEFPKS